MQRLLVIGKQIPRLTCIEWDEWRELNLLDYQGLIIDCRIPARIVHARELVNLLTEFMRNAHAVFIVLPDAVDVPSNGLELTVLPYLTLFLQPMKGATLLPMNPSPLANEYVKSLHGHQIIINPRPTVPNIPFGWKWVTTISDNVKRAVCGAYGPAHILHAPAPGSDAVAIQTILDFFHPDYIEPEPEPQPEWATEVSAKLPGMAELEELSSAIGAEIARLQSQLEGNKTKKLELARWTEILWLDGVPLQERVLEALTLLGIPNKSQNPTGHAQDLEATCAGRAFLFEVTGSHGSIGIDKGRQLLQWLADCSDPTNTKGILIGNAFRKHAPDARPPSPNHRIFVKELEDMANKFHLGLVDVRNIFELIVRKLSGEDIQAARICEELSADGVIRLS